MKLHLLGIPHTRPEHTHCAFTGKVVKFPRMMTPLGYEITYYGIGNDGEAIGATENVEVMTADEQLFLLEHDFTDTTKFHGDDANVTNSLYRAFNAQLKDALNANVRDGDIVLYPFGLGHADAFGEHKGFSVESGIGYPDCFLPFRIYESNAWMHYHQGKERRQGRNYEWVIGNYFVVDDWKLNTSPKDYILYFGRISDIKGLPTVVEIAKRLPHKKIVICGQGDPAPYLVSPNVEYIPPVTGNNRSELLGNAECLLAPSAFTEPFCGVAVEAMLCGTPAITTPFGAFTETIEHGKTGYRCHTLGDWLRAIEQAPSLDRQYIGNRARSLWSTETISLQYDRVFKQISELGDRGWYSGESHWVP